MKNMTLLFMACMTLSAPIALAEDNMAGMDHSMMDHSSMKMEHTSDQTDLYAPSRDEMHKNMMVKPSGNPDVDFAKNMLPHHEGAVAMAKVELEHGKDPELRKLAQNIIDSQEKEIAFMKGWLAKH